jgi:hypothetical protein
MNHDPPNVGPDQGLARNSCTSSYPTASKQQLENRKTRRISAPQKFEGTGRRRDKHYFI